MFRKVVIIGMTKGDDTRGVIKPRASVQIKLKCAKIVYFIPRDQTKFITMMEPV